MSEYKWKHNWLGRSKMISSLIPPNSSVLDVGGGICTLQGVLKEPSKYISIDIDKWSPDTVVFDLNSKDNFPDLGTFDYIVCAGIAEYIKDTTAFFKQLRQYGDTMILTFLSSNKTTQGRNTRTFDQLLTTLGYGGWEVVVLQAITRKHKMILCRKKS